MPQLSQKSVPECPRSHRMGLVSQRMGLGWNWCPRGWIGMGLVSHRMGLGWDWCPRGWDWCPRGWDWCLQGLDWCPTGRDWCPCPAGMNSGNCMDTKNSRNRFLLCFPPLFPSSSANSLKSLALGNCSISVPSLWHSW